MDDEEGEKDAVTGKREGKEEEKEKVNEEEEKREAEG